LCHQIIEARAGALMEKLNRENERLYDAGLQLHSGWASHGAAVLSG
jgi:hypothetical protein